MTKTVANRSTASAAMQMAAAKGRVLMGGTTAMRQARGVVLEVVDCGADIAPCWRAAEEV